MAEYAGYVAPKTVDYGALSSGLLSNKLAAEKLRKSEQSEALKLLQKQQAAEEKARIQKLKEETAEDKLLREDISGIKAAEYVPEKSFNTFATEGLGNIKNEIFELNAALKRGDITRQQYLINYNNLKDQWGQFTGGVKSFKTNLESLTKQVEDGKFSKIGAGLVGMYANTGQLANKVLKVKDVNGVRRLQQYTIDKDGNEIADETITNIGTLANASLFGDFSVDYSKKFKEADEAIGKFKIEEKLTTIESQKQNTKYNALLEQQIQGIIPAPIDKARLLTEKLGYDFYFTQQQKQALLDKGVKEDKMVKFALNDKGAYSPFLTKAQDEEAYNYTKQAIEGRMDYSKTKEKPASVRISTSGKKTQTEIKRDATFKKANDAYKSITELGDNSPYKKRIEKIYRAFYPEFGVTSRILYKDPANKKGIAGLAIYSLDEDGRPEREIDRLLTAEDFFGVYTPRDKKGEEDVEFMTAQEEEEGSLNELK